MIPPPPQVTAVLRNGLSYLFHDLTRSQYYFNIFSLESGDNTLMNYKNHNTNYKNTVASSLLEILGKLVSQFKRGHTIAGKR